MQTFNFEIHRKVTTWEKDHYSIEASSIEEAKQMAIEIFGNEDAQFDSENGFQETESCYDLTDNMSVDKNGGCATQELVFETVTILDNELKKAI